jgi:hypothetical protein
MDSPSGVSRRPGRPNSTSTGAPAQADRSATMRAQCLGAVDTGAVEELRYSLNDFDSINRGEVHGTCTVATATCGLPRGSSQLSSKACQRSWPTNGSAASSRPISARGRCGDGKQQAGIVLRRVTDLATEAGILWGVHGGHCIARTAGLRPGRPTAEPSVVVVLVGRGRRSIGLAGWVGSGDAVNPSLGLAAASMPRTPPPRLPTRP